MLIKFSTASTGYIILDSGIDDDNDNHLQYTVEPLYSGHFGTKNLCPYYRGFLNSEVI